MTVSRSMTSCCLLQRYTLESPHTCLGLPFIIALQKKISERDHLKLEYDKQAQEVEKLRAKAQSDPLKVPQV